MKGSGCTSVGRIQTPEVLGLENGNKEKEAGNGPFLEKQLNDISKAKIKNN